METKEGPNGTLEIRIENHISISDLFKNYFRQNKKVACRCKIFLVRWLWFCSATNAKCGDRVNVYT